MEFFCNDCPRSCGVLRSDDTATGFCGCYSLPTVVRAAPHFGEEPCISGVRGSGAVFFSGCNLKCVFCQNSEISRAPSGRRVDAEELADIFLTLQDKGVHNINLVTGTHFTRVIKRALEIAKPEVPVVWNSSGYEKTETLRMLEGLVDIYMPDYKYSDGALAKRYSMAEDYPEIAEKAIKEMYRQTGPFELDGEGMLKKGVIIRHLILPGQIENSMNAIDFAAEEFPRGSVMFSLMSQFTPMNKLDSFPEINRRVDRESAELLYDYMLKRHIEDGYWQEPEAAGTEMIPDFDLTGVEKIRNPEFGIRN